MRLTYREALYLHAILDRVSEFINLDERPDHGVGALSHYRDSKDFKETLKVLWLKSWRTSEALNAREEKKK